MNIVINSGQTTGHQSYWSFETCIKNDVYFQLYVDGRMRNICHYPGRQFTGTEHGHVIAEYRKKNVGLAHRPLTEAELRAAMFAAMWDDAHVENARRDEIRLNMFVEVLLDEPFDVPF